MAEEKKKEVFSLPEGRVINCHLFERDAYTDPKTQQKGPERYRLEIAFDPKDVTGEGTVEDKFLEAAIAEWGEDIEEDFLDACEGKGSDFHLAFLDGDKLAKRRERRGKEGDAYEGKLVLRCDTAFNKWGEDGPGGIEVFNENVEEVGPMDKGEDGGPVVYPGCYGIVAVTISCYIDNDGNPAQKCYLEAFQKTADGEKLVSKKSAAGMFNPIGKKKSAGGSRGRSKRASKK